MANPWGDPTTQQAPISPWLNQPTQYGQDGMAQVPTLNPWNGPNPFADGSGAQAQGATQGVQQNLQNTLNQYPAMPNSYGLGSQPSDPIAGAASNPDFNAQPITVAVPDTASRGFNPWSLSGEANSRGK